VINRLFIFGDSFTKWDYPKYHWTWYLSNHYQIINYGRPGADNYSILFQLGDLEDYKEGDRIIIYFSDPGRIPKRFYEQRYIKFKEIKKENSFVDTLKFQQSKNWDEDER